jgi:hypothetical protein
MSKTFCNFAKIISGFFVKTHFGTIWNANARKSFSTSITYKSTKNIAESHLNFSAVVCIGFFTHFRGTHLWGFYILNLCLNLCFSNTKKHIIFSSLTACNKRQFLQFIYFLLFHRKRLLLPSCLYRFIVAILHSKIINNNIKTLQK